MILADTSVWVEHLRQVHAPLRALLADGEVVAHPFVIGEIACGSLSNREEVLSLLDHLPSLPVASHGEVLAFVERRRLAGRGLGWIDVHLLASAVLGGATILTLDRRLARAAHALGVG